MHINAEYKLKVGDKLHYGPRPKFWGTRIGYLAVPVIYATESRCQWKPKIGVDRVPMEIAHMSALII